MTTYRLLGVDGRQYGPATTEQILQWIQQGRANAYSKICAEGTTEWKLVSDFPEFAAALPPQPPPTTAPTPANSSAARADAIAVEILARDYTIQIGRCFSRGWDLVMSHFWFSVGASVIIFLITWAAGMVPVLGPLLLTYVLWSGLDWLFLKMVRGQPFEMSDAFVGFSDRFVPLMLFSLISQLLTTLGLFLCIAPGIYLIVAWHLFAGLLIIDKKLDFWDAMELSRKVVTRHWWLAFGLLLLGLVIILAGVLACALGFFVALPVVTAAVVYAYEDIFGERGALPALTVSAPVPSTPAPLPPPATPTPTSGTGGTPADSKTSEPDSPQITTEPSQQSANPAPAPESTVISSNPAPSPTIPPEPGPGPAPTPSATPQPPGPISPPS